jgi:hypothetical protein
MASENLTHMEAITLAGRLQQTVAELHADLRKWKIEIKFETDPETFSIKVFASRIRQNEHIPVPGISVVLNKQMIQYYRDDQNALIDTVCETIFEQLIREQLIAEFGDDLKRVVNNTLALADRIK